MPHNSRNAILSNEEDTMSEHKSKAGNPKGGPRTEAGKNKSKWNSMSHGVLSNKMIVLQSESDAEYEHLKQSYYGDLQPVGLMESELVDEMIWAKWRQRRAITTETATIDKQMDKDAKKVEREIIDIDDHTRTACAIQTLANESNDLALLNRYETRFHRIYHRAFRQLLELQDRRKGDGQPVETKPPAPAPEAKKQKLPNEPFHPPVAGKKEQISAEKRSAVTPLFASPVPWSQKNPEEAA
jgi:hypothetical protein